MTSPGSDVRAEEQERLSRVVKLLTEVTSFVALATALLYYFGWVRSQTQARAFGADVSVFAMTTQDYVLRSLDVLLLPTIALLLLGLLAAWSHGRLRAAAYAPRVAAVLRWAWLLPLIVGLPLALLAPDVGRLAFPFWFALGVLATWYAVSLRRSIPGAPRPLPMSVVLILGALAALALFWMTERVASIVGETRAEQIKDDLAGELETVAVYSAARLHLDGPGVTETDLGDPEAAYRYRYEGLYLLQQSGGRSFLLTAGWADGAGRLVVLPDDVAMRLEFGPGA